MMMNDGSEDGLKHQDVSGTYIGMPSHFPVPSGSESVMSQLKSEPGWPLMTGQTALVPGCMP